MTLEEAEKFIEGEEFTFAKSYAKSYPHFYLQRNKCSEEKKYEDFLRLIREKGEVYSFHSKQYVYLEINGFVYWEMGRPITCVQVLNKAKKESLATNGQKKVSNDVARALLRTLMEREKYLYALMSKENKTDKDVNIIQFLTNTERRIHGGGKNIIDNYKIKVRYE